MAEMKSYHGTTTDTSELWISFGWKCAAMLAPDEQAYAIRQLMRVRDAMAKAAPLCLPDL